MEGTTLVSLLVFTLLSSVTGYVPRFHHGRPREGMLVPPPLGEYSDPVPPDMWFSQRLDHFNDADMTTWNQRYFATDKYYKPGGPVFLMIGGEGTASPTWMVKGAWIEYAKTYNAMCFQVEHRFYGKSRPTPDMSDANLRYLSSEQALADLAAFVQYAREKYHLQKNTWISFGGSYSGALSAWLRLKYPHLISAAVATSAPVLAQLNFENYLNVARDSLATTGPGCDMAVSAATTGIATMLQTQEGRDKLKTMFKLCDDIDITNANDVANLFETLTGNIAEVVQYNKEGRNITITTICDVMTDSSMPDPVVRYAKVNSLLSGHETKCVDFLYSKMIDDLKKTDWNSSAAVGGRQWTYQTCTEFGYYQSSDSDDQPFGHFFPLSFSIQQCKDIYGANFNLTENTEGVKRTNTNYGGLGISVTRTVFPNGSIDPWHALGIRKDLGPDTIAIYINGTAHCANMMPSKSSDPPGLVQARATIQSLIGKWITTDH